MNEFMKNAILQAEIGICKGDGGPFGAVIVRAGKIIGRGHNQVIGKNNPTLHGEMVAIADACKKLKTFDLTGCDIYTTSEPCLMCLTAALWANIRNIYFGCTIKDNDRIGFRDLNFDKLLGADRRRVKKLHQIDREECLALFDRYNKIKNKKKY